jgi:hypothetical protein
MLRPGAACEPGFREFDIANEALYRTELHPGGPPSSLCEPVSVREVLVKHLCESEQPDVAVEVDNDRLSPALVDHPLGSRLSPSKDHPLGSRLSPSKFRVRTIVLSEVGEQRN